MKHDIVKIKLSEILYSEGQDERVMYLVKQGRIRLFNTVNGQKFEGTTIFSGGVVGELSFFDGKPRESSVEALMNSTLIAIKIEDMKNQLEAIPLWFSTIINSIIGRVRKTEESVLKMASQKSYVDYTQKDLKVDNYTYICKKDFTKIITVFLMVAEKYSHKGVSSLEINFEALKQFIVRFQLGTSKLESVLKILEDHEIVKRQDLGEGRTKLELLNIKVFESLAKFLLETSDDRDLSQDAVRALNGIELYLKDQPIMDDGRKIGNVIKVQNEILLKEKYFLQEIAFKMLEENGLIKPEASNGDKSFKNFSFDPNDIEAFLPAQKVLSSLNNLNKEH